MKRITIITAITTMALILLVAACGGNKDAGKDNVLTDSRDGQTYRTVKIGNQTWMAENLNFKTENSWCYDNDESNCQKYGQLYDWNAAMKACPAGWRLPSKDDWESLVQVTGGGVAGTKLKSKSPDWNGSDDFGFSALPGGSRSTGGFHGAGDYGDWWSATERGSGFAWIRHMFDLENVFEINFDKGNGLSVRCVKE